MARIHAKRFMLVAFLVALLAIGFWAGSHYPALNEKAMMGGEIWLSGPGFKTPVEIAPDEKLVPRILYTTANWTYTNNT